MYEFVHEDSEHRPSPDPARAVDLFTSYGIAHLVAVKRPDTKQPEKHTGDYPAIDDFSQLMPQ